ncbi:origin recognition complex subunit 2-domain-containing protein [Halteromyces radiatus]|uniref:origin recognition complex subunit 2-domain-containing protein n=1 Tax=Halteromyces radiatus TaxID=101107 RepID=UPI00221F87F7|nr:origin recognition complex subunit 2-domain-containing protein [Halteromyces radiatus]KAI8099715.1 origin recognition complex subunit 2-domain-containing protein [Halteromyces radiatus]
MKLTSQTDQDIPIHIVSKVSVQQAHAEEGLAKQHGSIKTRQGQRGYSSFHLGLTTTNDNNKQEFYTNLQKRYEKDKEQQKIQTLKQQEQPTGNNEQPDEQTQRAIAEAEAYALSRTTTTNHDIDSEDEKENMDISGRNIFGFSTVRNKSVLNMMKRAIDDNNNNDQEDSSTMIPTKKRGRPSRNQKKVNTTQSSNDKRQRLERKMELVSYIQRREGKKMNTQMGEDDGNNDNDNDNDDDNDDDDDDSDDEVKARLTGSLLDEASGYERYFQDLHGSSKTSNNTLSKLPLLEPQEFQSILEAAPVKHGQERATLTAHHEQHFPQWLFELQSGFNLVFYGYGSKRKLINKFAMEVLNDGPLIVVNGFFPTITIKDIMTKILVGALEASNVPGTLQEQLAMIQDYFADEDRAYKRLYLVVHNMDGMNLRNDNAQSALATLAEASNIHLVGTIDQINAGLLWDNVRATRFNWIYHDATTFDNYLVETSFENSLLMRSSEIGGARGVQYVLASLTSNARGIFRVLAEYQLLEMEMNNTDRGSEHVGLPYHQYYEKCREQFFVSTETGMRSQLMEFKDHKVMVTKRLPDGTELFYMPLDKATLMGIIENME